MSCQRTPGGLLPVAFVSLSGLAGFDFGLSGFGFAVRGFDGLVPLLLSGAPKIRPMKPLLPLVFCLFLFCPLPLLPPGLNQERVLVPLRLVLFFPPPVARVRLRGVFPGLRVPGRRPPRPVGMLERLKGLRDRVVQVPVLGL